MMPTPSLRMVAAVCLFLALVAFLAIKGCSSNHEEAEQARQDARSSEAVAATAEVAVEAIIARTDEEATVDQIVAEAIKEIDNAPSDEAAGRAARAAICIMPEYRNDPSCRV